MTFLGWILPSKEMMGWVELEYTTAGVESCSVAEEEDADAGVVAGVVLW